jgi:hypothetical protein
MSNLQGLIEGVQITTWNELIKFSDHCLINTLTNLYLQIVTETYKNTRKNGYIACKPTVLSELWHPAAF